MQAPITLYIYCRKDCPFSVTNHCGKYLVCNHPSRVVVKPYANDRQVEPHIIDCNCPIKGN